MGGAEKEGALRGKVAIVTGAGRGIGRGISLAFAKQGARVVLASRSPEPLEDVQAAIEAIGGNSLPVVTDIGEAADIQRMVDEGLATFGQIDILVNCAQGWGAPGEKTLGAPHLPPQDLPESWWDHTFDTGVKATFRACRAAFPALRERGGSIINFGSGSGVSGMKDMADYVANKEGIRGLTRTLARSWGEHGITVNVICPAIETDAITWAREVNPEFVDHSNRPIPRFGDPERDAGALAVFLAGDGSRYLTGGTYMLDGGNLMLS